MASFNHGPIRLELELLGLTPKGGDFITIEHPALDPQKTMFGFSALYGARVLGWEDQPPIHPNCRCAVPGDDTAVPMKDYIDVPVVARDGVAVRRLARSPQEVE